MKTEELIHELSSQVTPVRPLALPIKRWAWATFFLSILVIVSAFVLGLNNGWRNVVSSQVQLFHFVVMIIIALVSGYSTFALAIPDYKNRRTVVWASAISLAALLGLVGLCFIESNFHGGIGWKCLRNILLLALPAGAYLGHLMRKSFALNMPSVLSMAALSVTALAASATRFICISDSPFHFLLWHGLPVACVAAVAALISYKTS